MLNGYLKIFTQQDDSGPTSEELIEKVKLKRERENLLSNFYLQLVYVVKSDQYFMLQ